MNDRAEKRRQRIIAEGGAQFSTMLSAEAVSNFDRVCEHTGETKRAALERLLAEAAKLTPRKRKRAK